MWRDPRLPDVCGPPDATSGKRWRQAPEATGCLGDKKEGIVAAVIAADRRSGKKAVATGSKPYLQGFSPLLQLGPVELGPPLLDMAKSSIRPCQGSHHITVGWPPLQQQAEPKPEAGEVEGCQGVEG